MKHILITIGLALLAITSTSFADYPMVPDFKLATDSGHIQPANLSGKIVYIDFWASWCKPCRKSFPWLNDIQSRYKDKGFTVLAINLDKDKALADKFLAQIPASFTIAYDPEGKSAESFQVQGMPSSYLIDRSGHLRARHIGFREDDKAELEQAVVKLLNE